MSACRLGQEVGVGGSVAVWAWGGCSVGGRI